MKSFSWTLALRYLNPLRAFFSVITLISLAGVSLGVMVLIVVLSVHAGFEQNLKEILLGSSPHVQVRPVADYAGSETWQSLEENLAQDPAVLGSYAFIEGYILMDSKNWQQPVSFRAIDTSNQAELAALDSMLDHESYPGSRTDMGLDDYVVVSRQLAQAMNVTVGEKIRVIAARNLEGLMEVLRVRDQERAYVLYADQIQGFEKSIAALLSVTDQQETGPITEIDEAYRSLQSLLFPEEDDPPHPLRTGEKDLLYSILQKLPDTEKDGDQYVFPVGTLAAIQADLKALAEIDLETENANALGNMEQFVLPKELTVWGVYHDTKRAVGPSLFVPLPIGQELKGLQDSVEAIGLRIADPYHADREASRLQNKLGPSWIVTSWMVLHQAQFQLVRTERMMTGFALSFIMLLSAFSIMAVMYTVTVQKRQEIGVMKALGARPSQVVRVFLYQGLVVGIIGALLGVLLGLLVIWNRGPIQNLMKTVGFDPFPADFHDMSEIPAVINPNTIAVVAVAAFILCLLAALVPALLAAFKDPARSLRNL